MGPIGMREGTEEGRREDIGRKEQGEAGGRMDGAGRRNKGGRREGAPWR